MLRPSLLVVVVLYRSCLEKKLFIVSHRKASLHSVWQPWDKQCSAKKLLGLDRACEETGSPARKAYASLFVCFNGECSVWHFANSAFWTSGFFSLDTFYFFDLLSSVQMWWDKQLWKVNHIVSLDKSQQFIHPKLLYMSGYFIEVVLKSTAMQFRVHLSLDSCVYSIAVGKWLLRRAVGR